MNKFENKFEVTHPLISANACSKSLKNNDKSKSLKSVRRAKSLKISEIVNYDNEYEIDYDDLEYDNTWNSRNSENDNMNKISSNNNDKNSNNNIFEHKNNNYNTYNNYNNYENISEICENNLSLSDLQKSLLQCGKLKFVGRKKEIQDFEMIKKSYEEQKQFLQHHGNILLKNSKIVKKTKEIGRAHV